MDPGLQTAPWKGLDPGREPQFLGYEQTERMIAALLPEAARWRPGAVAGVARGGLVPATMAATALALPLGILAYDRTADRAVWLGAPPEAGRILLVDDGCSSGATLAGVRAALLAQGRDCLTLAVVHDPDCAAYVPDLSHPMHALWRFPWERGEATPPARAWRACASGPERPIGVEAPFVAIDLEVARRRAARGDPLAGLPLFEADHAVIVGASPGEEQASAAAWLARCGYARLAVHCRAAGTAAEVISHASDKARLASRLGCTHLIEAEPDQAIQIAAMAPHLVVTWWSTGEDRGYVLGSAPLP